MATATLNFGTKSVLTVTNLHSLGDDAFWQSASIDNTTIKGFWAEVFITIVTTTTVGDANGVVNLRMGVSEDDVASNFSGRLTGSEGAYTDTLNLDHRHTTPIASFSCDAVETTVRTYKYRAVIQNVPKFFALLIENKSGAALASGGNIVAVSIHKYDSA